MGANEKHLQNSFFNINSNGTTVVQSAGNPGVLDAIVMGVVGSSGSRITVQNSGGTVFFELDGADANVKPTNLNMAFPDGLTIVSSGATSPDFTVLFR